MDPESVNCHRMRMNKLVFESRRQLAFDGGKHRSLLFVEHISNERCSFYAAAAGGGDDDVHRYHT